MRTSPILLSLLAATALAACGGGKGGSTVEGAASGGCREVSQPEPREDGGQTRPKAKLAPAKAYEVALETNCGTFTIRLDQKTSPATAASFFALAKAGFFDGTVFHRIVPGFVIQGGDPTASGQGGPGYATVDPPPGNTRYVHYLVAMAKTAAEDPGTAGSQFFVVTADDAGLPPQYAVLGKVTTGKDVVDRIAALGGPDELPTRTVEIVRARASER